MHTLAHRCRIFCRMPGIRVIVHTPQTLLRETENPALQPVFCCTGLLVCVPRSRRPFLTFSLARSLLGRYVALSKRARRMATTEGNRAACAITHEIFVRNGYEILWASHPSCCEHCQRLDGKSIAKGSLFADKDTGLGGLKEHPPLHHGCKCTIQAGKRMQALLLSFLLINKMNLRIQQLQMDIFLHGWQTMLHYEKQCGDVMPNILWYYIAVSIGLMLLIFTFIRKKPFIDLLCFFFASAAVSYLLESIVLFVFRSYDYKPGIFPNPIAEDIFGHLICNGLFWGGFIMLISTYSLRFYWVALVAIFFMLVEEFFLNKGLYIHFWWRTYFTGIGAFIILIAMKRWYAKLKAQTNTGWRFAAFYFISWLLLVAPSLVLLLAGKQHYSIGLSQDYYLDDIFTDVPYCLLMSFLVVFFFDVCKKTYWKAFPFVIILLGDILLNQFGVLAFKDGWSLYYLMGIRASCLLIYIVTDRHSFRIRPVQSV